MSSTDGTEAVSVLPVVPVIAVQPRQVVLDCIERFLVILVYTHFVWALMIQTHRPPNTLMVMLLVSETIPVALIALRGMSSTLSRRPGDWFLGLAGMCLPLLVWPADLAPLLPTRACFLIMLLGMYTQIAAKIVLGRSFGIVAANRGVVTLGPYRFLRHPMYVGYVITQIGFLMFVPSVANAVLYLSTFCIQIPRLLREERVLMCDPAYRAYAARVRWRVLPGIF